jgi:hypothetical protein
MRKKAIIARRRSERLKLTEAVRKRDEFLRLAEQSEVLAVFLILNVLRARKSEQNRSA